MIAAEEAVLTQTLSLLPPTKFLEEFQDVLIKQSELF